MNIIFLLIILSLLIAIGFLIAFFWAVNDGQFNDDITPGMRILLDNKKPPPSISHNLDNGQPIEEINNKDQKLNQNKT